MRLRYGINPGVAATATPAGDRMPIEVIAGTPSYINLLDALTGWQLVWAVASALDRPAATSFKHVSPAGAAVSGSLDHATRRSWHLGTDDLSPVASAYARARDCDPRASFGDFIAVSHPVDADLAELVAAVVSNGIIAPAYEPGTVTTLAGKQSGTYVVLQVDPSFVAPGLESRELFGVRLTQQADEFLVTRHLVRRSFPSELTAASRDDLVLALITTRLAQSNAIVLAKDGATIGVGSGQQSRIDCTRLAGGKADTWWMRRHPAINAHRFKKGTRRQDAINWRVLAAEGALPIVSPEERAHWARSLRGVVMASDGFIPFRDNVDEAARHGVEWIADPGGGARSGEILEACQEHRIGLGSIGQRLFLH